MEENIDRYSGETQDILKAIAEAGREDLGPDCEGNCYPCTGCVYDKRPTKDEYYIGIAKAVSKRSTCLKRQYGAVIVNNDEIIATGYNGNPRGLQNCIDIGRCSRLNKPHNSGDYSDCHSIHAEQNAMLSAARRDMIGATMYLYGEENGKDIIAEPCPICRRMIMNAGIKAVIS